MGKSPLNRFGAIAAAAVLVAIGVSATLSGCQTRVVTSSTADRDTVTVAGTGVALTRPDRASVTFGVTVDAPDAKTAMRRASTTADAVTKALKAAGVDDKDLQTTVAHYAREFEMKIIRSVLLQNNGNISRSAVRLGISRKTLYAKIRRHDLGVPQ